MKQTLRVAILFSFACAALASFSNLAQAQRVDLAFGGGTLISPSGSSVSTTDLDNNTHQAVSLGGGTYLGISGDVIFWHHLGIASEIDWRASQGEWGGYQPFRPLLYDVNAVYNHKLFSRATLEVQGGIGALSTRFYSENANCSYFSCTNYSDSNHFFGDFGAGLKLYAKGNFFIRPEARFYLVHNNLEFSANHATRVGVGIGYTFGGR